MQHMHLYKVSSLLLGVSIFAFAGMAHAQVSPGGEVTDAPGIDTRNMAAATTEDTSDQVITVTGSRVIRDGNHSPTPVTVIATDTLSAVAPGDSLNDSLSILPAFAGSRGSSGNPASTGSVGAGNAAANQLNLRNLGVEKTLSLIDGVRLAPTTFSGIVDVDTIPEMLIARVDVVTGGASAVYGSDAVSGVVNYVIDKNFTGLRAKSSFGISEYGDAESFVAGVAFGTKVGDRGHFIASYQYRDEKGILHRSDRPWLRQAGITGAGTASNPYKVQQDIRQKDFPFGGLITTGALAGQTFKANGVLSPFVNGIATGTSALQIGGDGGYWDSSLYQPNTGHQAFGRFEYELTDNLSAYVQFTGNFKVDTNYAEHIRLNNVFLAAENAFLAPQYRQILANAGQATFRLSGIMGNGPRSSAKSESDQRMFFAGLRGAIGEFNWDLTYVHARSELDTTMLHDLNNQRLAHALDAVLSGGRVVCRVTVTNPGLADDCVPLNVFGPTAFTDTAIDYITDDVLFNALTKVNNVSASVTGAPFSTWAGDVNIAFSGEYRKMTFTSFSDSNVDDVVDCTGTRFNCSAGTPRQLSIFFTTPKISEEVAEGAFEFDAPLLVDSAIAQALNLNGAVRYTNYKNSGSYWTWKAGLDWQVSDTLRFRATRSRDIRAPTLYDLFFPGNASIISPNDLLTNTTPILLGYVGSNPDLKAEVGNTLTGGVVWTPSPGLSVALDAYKITVTDSIATVQGWDETIQRACYDSGGSSPYCLLQERPNGFTDTSPSNAVTGWRAVPLNIAEVETYGVDLEVNYRGELFRNPFEARFFGAWQPHIYYRQPTVETRDQGGVAFGPLGGTATPKWRFSALLRYQPIEKLTVDVLQRWRSAMKLSGIPSQVYVSNHMASFATTSVTLTYEADVGASEAEFFVGVSNLFNADPPVGGFTTNGTRAGNRDGFASGDDVRGRYYTAGIRIRL